MSLWGIAIGYFFLKIDKLFWQIANTINQLEGKSSTSYMEVMRLSKKYKIEAKGVLKFCKKHDIQAKNSPVCIMPTTAHISLFKGTNLTGMGLGEDETILIACDKNSRMKTDGEWLCSF